MNTERTSRAHSITHPHALLRESINGIFAEKFANPAHHPAEREKTPQETMLIEAINSRLEPFVEKYGGTYLPLTPDHYKLLSDTSKMSSDEKEALQMNVAASGDEGQQLIKLYDANISNPLKFAHVIVHESIHFQSYGQVVIDQKRNRLRNPRRGLFIWVPGMEEELTSALDEAITEELTMRFLETYAYELPFLSNLLAKRKDIREQMRPILGEDADDIANILLSDEKDDESEVIAIEPNGYKPERVLFGDFSDAIVDQASTSVASGDVFDVFARAYFTGDMRPSYELIKTTLGRNEFKRIFRWENRTLEEAKKKVLQ